MTSPPEHEPGLRSGAQGEERFSTDRDSTGVVVAVLACPPCDEVAYSAIVPQRPDLAQACPACRTTMTLSDLIVGE